MGDYISPDFRAGQNIFDALTAEKLNRIVRKLNRNTPIGSPTIYTQESASGTLLSWRDRTSSTVERLLYPILIEDTDGTNGVGLTVGYVVYYFTGKNGFKVSAEKMPRIGDDPDDLPLDDDTHDNPPSDTSLANGDYRTWLYMGAEKVFVKFLEASADTTETDDQFALCINKFSLSGTDGDESDPRTLSDITIFLERPLVEPELNKKYFTIRKTDTLEITVDAGVVFSWFPSSLSPLETEILTPGESKGVDSPPPFTGVADGNVFVLHVPWTLNTHGSYLKIGLGPTSAHLIIDVYTPDNAEVVLFGNGDPYDVGTNPDGIPADTITDSYIVIGKVNLNADGDEIVSIEQYWDGVAWLHTVLIPYGDGSP